MAAELPVAHAKKYAGTVALVGCLVYYSGQSTRISLKAERPEKMRSFEET